MVVNSLRAHAKAVDIDWKTNLNAHLASGLPLNNSNEIQNVVRPCESSCVEDGFSSDYSK